MVQCGYVCVLSREGLNLDFGFALAGKGREGGGWVGKIILKKSLLLSGSCPPRHDYEFASKQGWLALDSSDSKKDVS